MPGKMIELTPDNFDARVLQAPQLVVIEFGAEWCAQCKALEPMIQRVAEIYDGNAEFFKCDVSACPDIAARYGIMSVPVTVFINNGETVEQLHGMIARGKFEDTLKRLI
jgi:thioredoxin 1